VTPPTLRTERLLLRPWRDADREPFAAMNADARTMEHFPALWTRQQSDEFVDRAQAALERDGFGPWAVEVAGVAPFIGFVSLERVRQDLPFAPAIEVMWRFSAGYWGRGYAPEAAVAAMTYRFGQCGFEEIVGFSSAANTASRRMNRRLQMVPDPAGDFEYPGLPGGHRLLRHVLYRARRDSWPGRALTGREWNQLVIDEFRAHGGQAGDTFEGSRLLILTSTGARTGQPRTNPTMYLPDGGRYIIFATSGGRPHNPAWYHNLKAHPRARAEVGTDTFEVTAEEITGHERDRLYRRQAAADPSFADYEKKTARQIPVIALHRARYMNRGSAPTPYRSRSQDVGHARRVTANVASRRPPRRVQAATGDRRTARRPHVRAEPTQKKPMAQVLLGHARSGVTLLAW
jgi:deazaflavin-dependent oxidoreductase (nitroreductase family)